MKDQSIDEIKKLLNTYEGDLPSQMIEQIESDSRKGVQKLWNQYCKRKSKEQSRLKMYIEMSQFEEKLEKEGYRRIAGVDEVGRGPLAGPVVASAVILNKDTKIIGLNDSKKLSERVREQLYEEIIEQSIAIGVGIVSAEEIDQINIYQASKLAMKKAIEDLPIDPDYLLIDAMNLDVDLPQDSIIKGDAKSVSIAAASIIAKVTRDRYMKKMEDIYPHYSFGNNVGYGTAEHLQALSHYGITPEHRKSFAPVAELIPNK
ncbi:ribonuclease HII [Pseudalkalibacillus berkeleyi]|uniref:Ribonuclease HII n=1 Tax=Pseudalkalibacillus berkeleyi TaxID=1069813 RepID=A0ABS9GZS0_9BACL|nr:ribonuclease HII [Pseudalkalibacillus berkeleyi]MCF6137088.1 ribonuclease HII [Pseudalkalibacillus berkeleyi]